MSIKKCISFVSLIMSGILSVHCNPIPYDMEEAKEICDSWPLDLLEGIWSYPEDRISVLVLRDKEKSSTSFDHYSISVIESEDCRLNPGDIIGEIEATPEQNTFAIKLYTEQRKNILSKPEKCEAKLSNENETLVIKKNKSGLRFRFNLNFNRLLPGFWKIVSSGISRQNQSTNTLPVGMVKIYPSYDGNGSSKRQPRYL